ncbi:DUF4998 domain-containing protein [Fulvivirgaceae bacterium BMA10]|uniref:DUF4998 domain-containing protein n=1 Tax=Splendidivirga corallicola TaxID=3051826 RepID=A0ABT8KXW5_9BACT|nr:DUF4998 domain-containing protein [Fulvivirgaceae bacterium BMA10]
MKNLIANKWIYMLVVSIAILSCETTEETFQEFASRGETIYIGKPDTVFAAPGFEKLRFWIAINADPKIKKGLIETTDGSIVHEFDVIRVKDGRDTIQLDLDLEEDEYSFNVYLMDESNRKSIRTELDAKVFGENYRASLINRTPAVNASFDGTALITWSDPAEGTIETVLKYEDASGVERTVIVGNDETETAIDSYKLGGNIVVSSTYMPTENAIEVFEAIPTQTTFDQFKMDKSIIVPILLPGDAGDGHASAGGYASLLDDLIADWTNLWHSGGGDSDYPFVMTFDLGTDEAKPGKFRLDGRPGCCRDRQPADLQIWGINDLTGAETANIKDGTIADWEADAIAKGWVKLHQVTGNTNDRTIEVAFNEAAANYRYIRIVPTRAINNDVTANLSEFTFWSR